jgi:hypothetical protein
MSVKESEMKGFAAAELTQKRDEEAVTLKILVENDGQLRLKIDIDPLKLAQRAWHDADTFEAVVKDVENLIHDYIDEAAEEERWRHLMLHRQSETHQVLEARHQALEARNQVIESKLDALMRHLGVSEGGGGAAAAVPQTLNRRVSRMQTSSVGASLSDARPRPRDNERPSTSHRSGRALWAKLSSQGSSRPWLTRSPSELAVGRSEHQAGVNAQVESSRKQLTPQFFSSAV